MFQKDMRFALLLDYYGDLLGEQRRSIMELYYCEDLSLSEIAENTGITRQAVRDSIKKGEAELHRLEDALHLAVRMEEIRVRCESAVKEATRTLETMPEGDARTSLSRLIECIEAIPN